MTISRSCAWLALAAIAASFDAGAGVYKCVDTDDRVTYSQTPCPNQVTTTVDITSNDRSGAAMDCTHASQFAFIVAEAMQQGTGSAETFAHYGGIGSLSRNAVNVVNYVYLFQPSRDVSPARIAELATSKCKARAFGDINCKAMPSAYVERIGGCDADRRDTADAGSSVSPAPSTPQATVVALQGTRPDVPSARTRSTEAASDLSSAADFRQECRDRAQSEIDGINARMRSGYSSSQGEQYRRRLNTLRRAFNDC